VGNLEALTPDFAKQELARLHANNLGLRKQIHEKEEEIESCHARIRDNDTKMSALRVIASYYFAENIEAFIDSFPSF
jgi:hypothetical protein